VNTHLRTVENRNLQVTKLDFEGVGNVAPVGNFYNGGAGPNFGVSFSSNAFGLVDSDAGGNGNIANEPSASTVLFFDGGFSAIMNVPAGFDTRFLFYYASPTFTGSFAVYRNIDGTGDLMASGTLAPNGSAGNGDPSGQYNTWTLVEVSFSGIAKSIVFTGYISYIVIDDITFVPFVPSVEPTTSPSSVPTEAPSKTPTSSPTSVPTAAPSKTPTSSPTSVPTEAPSKTPTMVPIEAPTKVNCGLFGLNLFCPLPGQVVC
jgi:hypothetical protein